MRISKSDGGDVGSKNSYKWWVLSVYIIKKLKLPNMNFPRRCGIKIIFQEFDWQTWCSQPRRSRQPFDSRESTPRPCTSDVFGASLSFVSTFNHRLYGRTFQLYTRASRVSRFVSPYKRSVKYKRHLLSDSFIGLVWQILYIWYKSMDNRSVSTRSV